MSAMTEVSRGPQTINLEGLNAVAALQTRRDRKYIVAPGLLQAMLDSLGSTQRVLEIDGRRQFGYESVYFDTDNLDLFRAAATSRRRRYKVRTRTYMDSSQCMLEVKTKGGRGENTKDRLAYDIANRSRLTGVAVRFIDETVHRSTGMAIPPLTSVLTTRYDRSTYVDLATETRLTVDHNLVCSDWSGRSVTLAGAVVETKSSNAPGPVDHWLWTAGLRPVKISKFGTGLAALHSTLPSNKWHRTLKHGWNVS